MSGNFQPRNEAELSETLRGCTAEKRRVRLSGGGLIAKSPPEGTLGVWLFGITGIEHPKWEDYRPGMEGKLPGV